MLKDTVETERVIVNEYPQGLEIIIPAQNSVFMSGLLTTWLVAWFYGEVFIFGRVINGTPETVDGFTMLWLGAWTVGGIYAAFLQVWNTRGREIIRVDDKELRRSRDYVLFSRSGRYPIEHIRDMRLTELDLSRPDLDQSEFWGVSGGLISFDYGQSTQKLGLDLNEKEASRLIDLLKARYPV